MFSKQTPSRPQWFTLASPRAPYPGLEPIGLLADVSEASLFLRPFKTFPADVARNRKNPPSKSAGFSLGVVMNHRSTDTRSALAAPNRAATCNRARPQPSLSRLSQGFTTTTHRAAAREAVERQTCLANKLQPRPQWFTLASPRALYPRLKPIGLLADVSEASLVLRPFKTYPADVARNRKNPPNKSAGFSLGVVMYAGRSQTIERAFGDAKLHRSIGRLRGRGLLRARASIGLLVLGQNILGLNRLLKSKIPAIKKERSRTISKSAGFSRGTSNDLRQI